MKVRELGKLNEEELNEVVVLSKLINEEEKTIKKLVPFVSLEYGQMLELKACVRDGEDERLMQMVLSFNGYNISIDKLLDTDVKKYFRTLNFIENQFLEIGNLEKELETETDAELVASGINELNKFGDLNVIDALAGGDILKWEQVLQLTYSDVYSKLLKTKTENDIKSNLDKLSNQRK